MLRSAEYFSALFCFIFAITKIKTMEYWEINMDFEFKVIKPNEANKNIIDQVTEIIFDGGSVNGTKDQIRKRLMRAAIIGVTMKGDEVVSTISLKVPYKSYKESVSEKFGINVSDFEFEIGYAATKKEWQGKRLISFTIDKFFEGFLEYPRAFATTKNKTLSIQLINQGFKLEFFKIDTDLMLLTYKK